MGFNGLEILQGAKHRCFSERRLGRGFSQVESAVVQPDRRRTVFKSVPKSFQLGRLEAPQDLV
jgi:hypothetical protein